MNVAAVVPARDEADRIAVTIAALSSIPGIRIIVVADDGSTDGTDARAAAAGARVVRSERTRGKGAALAAGVRATTEPILVFCDADLGDSARGIEQLIRPVVAGELDMAIAAPPPGPPSGFGLVEQLARTGIRRLAGLEMRRPLSGQRALRRELLERVAWPVKGFGVEVALTIDAVRAGSRVGEVTMPVEHRHTGRNAAGFLHRGRQGAAVLRELARRGVRFGSG